MQFLLETRRKIIIQRAKTPLDTIKMQKKSLSSVIISTMMVSKVIPRYIVIDRYAVHLRAAAAAVDSLIRSKLREISVVKIGSRHYRPRIMAGPSLMICRSIWVLHISVALPVQVEGFLTLPSLVDCLVD